MSMTETFATINARSWDQILRRPDPLWQPPLTVHLPIHPAHAPDFLHVDCALNAVRRRVFPNMRTQDPQSAARRAGYRALVVQFALDDPPFLPDLHQTRLSLVENRWPVARADYYAWNLYYDFEYAAQRLADGQTLLRIRVGVTNEGGEARPAHVRCRVHFPIELKFFDYHYVAFHWDRRKWEERAEGITYGQDCLFRDGRRFGRIRPGAWELAWEAEAPVEAAAVNRRFSCAERYYVQPHLRLDTVRDAVHARTLLAPGERRDFTLALLVDEERVTPGHLAALDRDEAGPGASETIAAFQSLIPEPPVTIEGKAGGYDNLIHYLPLNTLQLLVDFGDGHGLTPTQGGGDERYYVWVWEALCMLRPMLALGYFEPVRRALEFIFSLQDGGCPPQGEFTRLDGAIGTTGPRWLNATGSALGLAADYAAVSQDGAFTEEYLPKMLRAADWLIGEVRATRRPAPDGTRPITFGLLPFGHGTDGDLGHAVSLSDSYSLWGLDRLAALLESRSHPRAAEVRAETERYRSDLGEAIVRLTRPDGFIDRKIVTGRPDERYSREFEHVCGAVHYAVTGALPPGSERFRKYMAYFETHLADHYFTGRMSRDVVYIGTSDALWHEVWLKTGAWKKAFAVMQAVLRYGMSQDAFQTQERFSRRDPAFTCWQPNGSGNGRLIGMILNSFYFEYRDETRGSVAVILGGMPWAWLEDNGVTALRNLRTPGGLVNVVAERLTDGQGIAVTVERTERNGILLRFPDFVRAVAADPAVREEGPGCFRVPPGQSRSRFTLSRAPESPVMATASKETQG